MFNSHSSVVSQVSRYQTKSRPIIFSGPMVGAILDGKKTQTRRIVNPQPVTACPSIRICDHGYLWDERDRQLFKPSKTGHAYRSMLAGDTLWVREAWTPMGDSRPSGYWSDPPWKGRNYFYAADNNKPTWAGKWRPSIHMPRSACRLFLRIDSVKVERLQDISEADAIAEGLLSQLGDGTGPGSGFKWNGIGYHGAGFDKYKSRTYHVPDMMTNGRCSCHVAGPSPAQCAFRELWDSINGNGSWEKNPWVWRIEFSMVKP